MKRSPLKRSTKRMKRGWIRRKSMTMKKMNRIYGDLATFLIAEDACQAAGFAPGPCGTLPGRWLLERCHAVTGAGRRSAWVLRDGKQVGNLFLACPVHHDWCDGHKAESLDWMKATAVRNGERYVAARMQEGRE